MTSRRTIHAAAMCGIAIAVVMVYWHTRGAPFFFDDFASIKRNEAIRIETISFESLTTAVRDSPKQLRRRAVAFVSFALNYRFSEYDTTAYRLVNIGIHIVNGWLVYLWALLTLRLAGLSTRVNEPPDNKHKTSMAIPLMALFTAALWALHPLQTNAVTYIVQRMTSLSTMFLLLALCLFIHGRNGRGYIRWCAWIVALGSWLLALGNKEIAITLPAIILLYEAIFYQKLDRAWLRRCFWYMLILLVVAGVAAWLYLGNHPLERLNHAYEKRHFTMPQRILTEFRVVIFYLTLIFLPLRSRLNLNHYPEVSTSLFSPPTTVLCVLAVLALLAGGVWLARRQPLVALAVAWYFINLILESSVVGLELVYEHRTYLPSIAVSLAVTAVIYQRLRLPPLRFAVFAAIALLLAFGTYRRNLDWLDAETLWKDCVAKAPNHPRTNYNLGLMYSKDPDRLDEAITHQERAIANDPDFVDAHNNLGYICTVRQQYEQAIPYYEAAIAAAKRSTDSSARHREAYSNLGKCLIALGRHADALPWLEQALEINGSDIDTRLKYGNTLITTGAPKKAAQAFEGVLRRDADSLDGMLGMADSAAALKLHDQAEKMLTIAISKHPQSPRGHYQLGLLHAGQQQFEAAAAGFIAALEVAPDYLEARYNLGNARRDSGQLEDALQTYKELLALQPEHFRAWYNSARILSQLQRFEAAERCAAAAIELRPSHFEIRTLLAESLVSQGKVAPAIPHLKAVIANRPERLKAYELLGFAYFQMDEIEDCIAIFEAALRIRAEQPDIHRHLGAALMKLDRIDDAIGHFQEAVRLAPGDTAAHRYLEAARQMQQSQEGGK